MFFVLECLNFLFPIHSPTNSLNSFPYSYDHLDYDYAQMLFFQCIELGQNSIQLLSMHMEIIPKVSCPHSRSNEKIMQ
jgi:hypothetical protein